jgi:hypothetical protein
MLAAPLGLALAVSAANISWADDSSESVTELKAEVNELKQEVNDLKTQVGTIHSAQEVKTVDKPATIGEHVGGVVKDLGDLKKDLNTNLGVHIHGLVDGTYEYNVNQPDTTGFSKGGPNAIATGGRTNQLRVFDVDANGWTVEQFNLHVDKTADGGVGFATDINFGQVANVLRASTRNSNLNPFTTANDIVDPTQMYLTYTAPIGSGINLQLGRFVTLLGEEIIPTWNANNFNISRDFIFGFAIPFTHTGLRAQYAFNDKVAATLGVNNGWDDISDNNDGQTVEGQISLNSGSLMSESQSLALALNGIYGPEQVNHGNSQRWVIDPILTYKTFVPGLQLVGEFVYGSEGGPVSVFPAVTSNGNSLATLPLEPAICGAALCGSVRIPHSVSWSAAAGYIVYDWSDALEFATRGEWFRDADGARTGLRQTLGEVTETINYKIPGVTGLLARLEYRHDESNHKPFFSNDGFTLTGVPRHTYSGQDTMMASAVYSF